MNNFSDLVTEIKSGSKKHFEVFFEQNCGVIFHTSVKMGFSREEAEEIVQDTFVSFWNQRSHLNIHLNPVGLLKIIAKRLMYKRFQIEEVQIRSIDFLEEDLIDGVYGIDSAESISAIKIGMEKLPNSQKEVLELYYFEGLDVAEISAFLNISSRTVENNMYRAKKYLKNIMTGNKVKKINTPDE